MYTVCIPAVAVDMCHVIVCVLLEYYVLMQCYSVCIIKVLCILVLQCIYYQSNYVFVYIVLQWYVHYVFVQCKSVCTIRVSCICVVLQCMYIMYLCSVKVYVLLEYYIFVWCYSVCICVVLQCIYYVLCVSVWLQCMYYQSIMHLCSVIVYVPVTTSTFSSIQMDFLIVLLEYSI